MGIRLKDLPAKLRERLKKEIDEKPKGNKYNAKKVVNQYGCFDSNAESGRFFSLMYQEKAGIIRDLRKQVRFEIIPAIKKKEIVHLKTKDKVIERVDESARHYTCDFMYTRVSDGVTVIEDVKSEMTSKIRDYGLRRHLMKWLIVRMNEEGGKYEFNEIIY